MVAIGFQAGGLACYITLRDRNLLPRADNAKKEGKRMRGWLYAVQRPRAMYLDLLQEPDDTSYLLKPSARVEVRPAKGLHAIRPAPRHLSSLHTWATILGGIQGVVQRQ